ncbi:mitochondrial folate transporter/carrier-like [Daphnia pulex]|uniref:mitochondrial folate transporter/carrier-like n=1 Tax=Daphnia pulex TaxID=6669 RepID=UPI001EDD799C|nr:mitochondrial folate transporter/carrier-like [Daphnia pulex]XP_046438985.1 mitochondrial folate transporter/carrier-like [Daphnia pulex]XP_046438986.1 mitochondrial folate transporter/carrier-like [Daphnia pulex]
MKSSTNCNENEKTLFTSFCYPMTALFGRYGIIKYEPLLAGIAGGVVSTTILHPLDTIRTRLAVSGSPLIAAGIRRPSYGGLVDVLTTITRSHGVQGVYRGITLGVLAAGCTWGSYFFFYDARKAQMHRDDPTRASLGAVNHMMAATESGLITLVLTNPIYVIKTRLCLQFGAQEFSEEKRYSGIIDALVKTYRNEGIKGFYKGLLPGFFGVSHTAIQLMMYEEMKSTYKEHHNMSSDSRMSTMTYLSFTALSKLIAVITTYPYRLMRTRMQDQHHEHNGPIDMVTRTWRYEGIRGFYKGMLPTLLRVTPATAITFVVYENLTHYFIENSVASKNKTQ